MTWEIIKCTPYSAQMFKSVLDVREQHEGELTDTELKVLDELTLVNSHFVTLCDYYGNVRLESITRAPP